MAQRPLADVRQRVVFSFIGGDIELLDRLHKPAGAETIVKRLGLSDNARASHTTARH